jgi:hypothetical protein
MIGFNDPHLCMEILEHPAMCKPIRYITGVQAGICDQFEWEEGWQKEGICPPRCGGSTHVLSLLVEVGLLEDLGL